MIHSMSPCFEHFLVYRSDALVPAGDLTGPERSLRWIRNDYEERHRAKGAKISNVVTSTVELALMLPPCVSMIDFTIAKPRPAPSPLRRRDASGRLIGRASCRERVCQYV